MINVQTVHPFDIANNTEDTDHWACYEWPQQTVVVGGVGGPYTAREDAVEAFVAAYNSVKGTSYTEDDFRFFGPIIVTAYITQLADGYLCSATADRTYSVVDATEDSVKIAFMIMWNDEYATPNNSPYVTDTNVDWVTG